jgi:molecular chaperone GrpE (heat shock protein)
MNRLQLAIKCLMKGEAALHPTAPSPVQQAIGPTEVQRPPDEAPQTIPESTRQLIALRDSVQAAAEDLDEPGRRALNAVARQLAQILTTEQVVPFEDSGTFDAHRHNAVSSMETSDSALDYQLAASVRSGYTCNGTLLRRQDVVVYRFTGDNG